MSLRNCLSANVKELASSELAMHVPLMSWIASMDSDRSVHFAKQIPQRAANLYVDGALSPANMAQVVLALKKLSQGGLQLDIEPKLLDAYHQLGNEGQVHFFGREWEQVRCQ